MTPLAARLTFLGLIVLAGAISANALYMQPPAETRQAVEKQKSEQEQVGSITAREADSPAAKRAVAPYRETEERSARPASPEQPRQTRAGRPRSETAREERATPRRRASPEPPRREVVRAIQRELSHRDYPIDRRDGDVDLSTRLAILLYEYDSQLTLTGRPSEVLLEQILFGPFRGAGAEPPVTRFETDRELVANVQRVLSRLGFANLESTGQLGPDTRSALREFAHFRDLRPDGRLTPRLLLELADVSDEPIVQGELQ
jgi:hypothetical protein